MLHVPVRVIVSYLFCLADTMHSTHSLGLKDRVDKRLADEDMGRLEQRESTIQTPVKRRHRLVFSKRLMPNKRIIAAKKMLTLIGTWRGA